MRDMLAGEAVRQLTLGSDHSDCDSVKSFCKDPDEHVQTGSASIKAVTSQVFSGHAENAKLSFRSVPGVRQLEALRTPKAADLHKSQSVCGDSTAVGTSQVNRSMSRAGSHVTASTAGEWVSRLQALQDISAAHRVVAGKVKDHIQELIPQAKDYMDPGVEKRLLQAITQDLEVSRELLAEHAQGLIGSDLAELRIVKAENKKLANQMAKMNKQYTKELAVLKEAIRVRAEKGPEHIKKVMGSADLYEPLMFLTSEQRTCCLSILEEKLKALFSADPRIRETADKANMSKLEDEFRRERLAALEKQVAQLTAQLAESREQVAKLEAVLEHEEAGTRPGQAPSSSSSEIILEDGAAPQAPAGKPSKPGRPRFGTGP